MEYKIKETDSQFVIIFNEATPDEYTGKIPYCVFIGDTYHVPYDIEKGNIKYHDVIHIPIKNVDEDTKRILDKISEQEIKPDPQVIDILSAIRQMKESGNENAAEFYAELLEKAGNMAIKALG